MPNFDAGTYFLTTLAPIKAGAVEAGDGETAIAHSQALRRALAVLPTARQSPATITMPEDSPFARNHRNHFCRFVVIDDVVYNGPEGANAIVASVRNIDPIVPKAVDRLNAAYLLFAAEIDAVTQDGEPLPATLTEEQQDAVRDAYARELWRTAEADLRRIYDHCVGFDGVADANGFAAYLARCQIETTMPFHDYWTSPPDLKPLPTRALLVIAGLPVAAFLLTLILWPFDGAAGWSVLGTLVLAVAGLGIAYRCVMTHGQKAFPPPTDADLSSVLKSLYLQRHFADFVGDSQGATPEDLYAAFGQFLETHRPADTRSPTQPPGVIGTSI